MTSFFLRWYANPFRIAVLSGDYLIEISVQLPFDWLIARCLIKIWDPRNRIKSIYIIALVIYSRTSKDMDWGTDTTWPCFALNTEHQYWAVTVHTAATEGVMHLFDQNWWFCPIFCHLHKYISQNWCSDGYFEVLHGSESMFNALPTLIISQCTKQFVQKLSWCEFLKKNTQCNIW